MSGRTQLFEMTGTTPNAAGQAVVGKPVGGLNEYDEFLVYAELIGATGGTLDVYVQRQLKADVWVDWIHFTQLGAAAGAAKYVASSRQASGTAPVAVGKTADDGTTGAPALANSTVAPGHPGDRVRVVAVAGASTSAGAAIVVRIEGQRADW